MRFCTRVDRTRHGGTTEPDKQSSAGRIGGVDRATSAQLRTPAHAQLPADPVLQLDAKHPDRHGQLQSHQFPTVQGRRIGGQFVSINSNSAPISWNSFYSIPMPFLQFFFFAN